MDMGRDGWMGVDGLIGGWMGGWLRAEGGRGRGMGYVGGWVHGG